MQALEDEGGLFDALIGRAGRVAASDEGRDRGNLAEEVHDVRYRLVLVIVANAVPPGVLGAGWVGRPAGAER